MKVAIQGVLGAFHEIAARKYFNENITILPQLTFGELTTAVCDEQCDVGIMAIENSIAGSLLPNYQLLHQQDLKVTGEVYLRIVHNIMALKGQTIDDLKEIHSHQMALLQCQFFLNNHSEIKVVESIDTALSAKQIEQEKLTGVAAIASELAAEMYNLKIIKKGIETNKSNFTRFLIVEKGRSHSIKEGEGKLSIVFNLDDVHGALAKTLSTIADLDINLVKIQSFPIIGSKWKYNFIADLEFQNKQRLMELLDDLKKVTKSIHILGIYKKGEMSWS